MSQSTSTVPRYTVLANGVALSGVESISVTAANAYNCARFSFNKVFTNQDPNPPSWWADTANKKIRIEITVSLDGGAPVSLVVGNVDSHTFHPIQGQIAVEGRDLAALFIDTRITNTYRNLTSSQIVQNLAASQGITAKVTATQTIVGRYYDQDHDVTTSGQFTRAVNQWDLMCLLGQREGIVPYFDGDTLVFQPSPTPPPTFAVWCSTNNMGIVSSNALNITCDRHLTMAKDVEVTVKSWHSGQKYTYIGSAITKTLKKSASDPPPTPYVFYVPNLSRGQAQAMAQRLASDIAAHERVLSIELPGETTITPQHVINLTGTGTDFDGIDYFPQTVTRRLDFKGGFSTSVSAKNFSPLSLYDGASGALIR